MGKPVIKIIKTKKIIQGVDNSLSWNEVTDSEIYNPAIGYIDIQALDVNFISAIEVSSPSDLTLKRPRINSGAQSPLTINLSCSYSKDFDNPVELVNAVNYLYKASKSGYIGLLYWLPNSDDEISSGQAKDFWSSLLRVIQDNEWSSAVIPYADSGYTGTTINPLAFPVLIKSVNCGQEAKRNLYDIQIELEVIPRED